MTRKAVAIGLVLAGSIILIKTALSSPVENVKINGPAVEQNTAGSVSQPADISRYGNRPLELAVPSLNQSFKVVPTGLNSDGTLAVPNSFTLAGWYKLKSNPGIAPAVITGHTGYPNRPTVFRSWENLNSGDTFQIRTDTGAEVNFRIDLVEEYEQEKFPTEKVYGNLTSSDLRLITCTGDYNWFNQKYSHNLVIYATLME